MTLYISMIESNHNVEQSTAEEICCLHECHPHLTLYVACVLVSIIFSNNYKQPLISFVYKSKLFTLIEGDLWLFQLPRSSGYVWERDDKTETVHIDESDWHTFN